VFASVARLGMAMTRTQVASGIQNYAAIANLLSDEQWHYTLMISDGTRVLPQQYLWNDEGDGEALVASDAENRRLAVGDVYGMVPPLSPTLARHDGRKCMATGVLRMNGHGQPRTKIARVNPRMLRLLQFLGFSAQVWS
jgi:hypothetical protein